MSILQTDRLLLGEFSIADAPFLLELVNTPNWLRFIGDRGVKSISEAENYIKTILQAGYEKHGYGFYLVCLKTTNTPIGMCGLTKRDYLNHPDIGFAFLPDYFGQGYALEAAQDTLQYARNSLGLLQICAITDLANVASIRLLQKIGLHFDKMINTNNEELMLFES